ncbi:alpha/beta hydrolase [Polaribacter sp. IC073]|uniref:alpha/beta hydrolase n=1 Tax=Polaribacter sp. IC073 TaxID=2508540 RepID=UPI0011BEB94B|nr:alpha/beta hydrolase-fold protein [Polaribacter sp. IC073]TXD49961.1 alpha/beta hydrolase [Polaribacter sp. IC073]
MKTYLLLFLSFLFLILSCKEKLENKEQLESKTKEIKSTKAANVSFLEAPLSVTNLKGEKVLRAIWLYLPPNYYSSKEKYAVIYMHDAQNLFDNKTSFVGEWEIDETLNTLYQKTKKGFIVVGINNTKERMDEYSPWIHEKYGGGNGDNYLKMIVEELKPIIDKKYRTKPTAEFTGIIGSSMGGLISFYGGLKYPEVFGKIGALSTSFWFSEKVQDFASEKGNQKNTKLYFLVGGKEGDTMVPDTENMAKLLVEKGFPKENIQTKIVAEGKHTESFWKAEFLETITFLFNLNNERTNN